MVYATSGTPSKVKDMVSYFEKGKSDTVPAAPSRRKRSVTAMMNFTKRPWEHLPRRKSSSSTNPRRRSSTSTGSESTTSEHVEEQLADSGYAASERSGTSTAISEGRRRSANPDYDWEHDGEHDDIADLKAHLHSIKLWSPPVDTHLKGSDTTDEVHKFDSPGVGDRWTGTWTQGVHEIGFMEGFQPWLVGDESRPGSQTTKQGNLPQHDSANEVDISHFETVKDGVDEGECVTEAEASGPNSSQNSLSPQQPASPKIPIRNSSVPVSPKPGQLRLKTTQAEKDRTSADATSPNSISPKSKTRTKLAPDLPGIPESEAETLWRQSRHLTASALQQAPGHTQGVDVRDFSSAPASLRRHPVRNTSSPLLRQQTPPTQMADLINQRQVKFTNMREEKLRRLSNINKGRSSQHSLVRPMSRRHASFAAGETASRNPSARGQPAPAQRSFIGERRKSVSEAIAGFIRGPRKRPSFWPLRRRGTAR